METIRGSRIKTNQFTVDHENFVSIANSSCLSRRVRNYTAHEKMPLPLINNYPGIERNRAALSSGAIFTATLDLDIFTVSAARTFIG